MAEKCSLLKPWRLRNLKLFLSFSYYNFESTANYRDTGMSKKESFPGTKFIVKCLCSFESVYKTLKTI